MTKNEFNPDWVSPPGDTIEDILKEKGMCWGELIHHMDIDGETWGLHDGSTVIDHEVAVKLAEILGGTVEFWLAREKRYRESLAKVTSSSS